MQRKRNFLLLISILICSFLASLYLFYPLHISLSKLIPALSDWQGKSLEGIVIYNIRLPRSIMCILVGSSLGISGLLLQSLVRNPIASPTILGINSGCILAMVIIATGIFPLLNSLNITIGATIGSLLAWLIVMLISYDPTGFNKAKLILAGVTVSLLLISISRIIIIFSDDRALSILNWIAGSFANSQWKGILSNLLFSLPCLLLVMLLPHKLNLLALADDNIKSLGINLRVFKFLICVLALVLTSSAISLVGTIGFIGLLSPHLARFLVGNDNHYKIYATILIGSILALVSDMLSRIIFFPAEIPAGLIVAMIGSPYFLYIAIKKT